MFACSRLDECHKLVRSVCLSLHVVVLELKEFDVGGIRGGSSDGQGTIAVLFVIIWKKVTDP